MEHHVIIKKSPVKEFLLLQGVVMGLFFLASISAHYAKFYRTLAISNVVSFHLAEVTFLFSVETFLVFFIFFRWYKESFQIRKGDIIHSRGILYCHRTVIPLEHIASATHRQSPLGKLTKYGVIKLILSHKQKPVYFKDIPNPQESVDLILKYKRVSTFGNNGTASLTNNVADINDLLRKDEHENLEFKSTFRWDLKQNMINRVLEKSVMKTVAAFMNSDGGNLIIGIDDQRSMIGLKQDYDTLSRKDSDGFENHFSHIFHNMIGPEFRQFVRLGWSKKEDKEFCVVSVFPCHKPAYLKDGSNEEFYIRTGNATTTLKLSEANAYIDSRWKF